MMGVTKGRLSDEQAQQQPPEEDADAEAAEVFVKKVEDAASEMPEVTWLVLHVCTQVENAIHLQTVISPGISPWEQLGLARLFLDASEKRLRKFSDGTGDE